ncbi:MAG: magnesium transporter [Actinomycetota bacterium]|nr:magnesium transporter [Actinomycetota bacterium]
MNESNQVVLEAISEMLKKGEVKKAITTISNLHSFDAAEVLSGLEFEDEVKILADMEPSLTARALLEMEESHQVEIAAGLREGRLAEVLKEMPVDEAVDLLGDIPEEKKNRLMLLFGQKEVREFKELLEYPDDTAGGLMTPDFVSVNSSMTAEEVIEHLRAVPSDIETIYYVYVVGDDGSLRGVLSLRELIVSPPDRRVGTMVKGKPVSVGPFTDQEHVARLIEKYDLLAIPVVDDEGKMLGIVTVDDVIDVIGREAREDIEKFAGATGFEPEPGTLFSNITRRLPWFVVAVVVEVLVAGGILKLYSPILEKFVVLVFFLPLLVTMGGNIAIQSSTVVRYFLSSGFRGGSAAFKKLSGEVLWAVVVGIVSGSLIAGLAVLFHIEISVGFVVGLSLALSAVAAAIVGSTLPLLINAFHGDPGTVSGPMLGTTMDVLSLAIYLAIGRLLI